MDEFSHTFVVCAYKESPFLRDCLVSLTKQTLPARILMATSTPNDAIRSLAEEFGVPLFISDKPSGIGRDWNFAVSCAETDFVTIAFSKGGNITCRCVAQHYDYFIPSFI